jgi:hypothetical protein
LGNNKIIGEITITFEKDSSNISKLDGYKATVTQVIGATDDDKSLFSNINTFEWYEKATTLTNCPPMLQKDTYSSKIYFGKSNYVHFGDEAIGIDRKGGLYGNHNRQQTILNAAKDYGQGLFNCSDESKTLCDEIDQAYSKNFSIIKLTGGVEMATGVATAFQQCISSDRNACIDAEATQAKMLINTPRQLGILMDNQIIELSFLPSLIGGLVLVLFLLVLCIDVIVRQFKLLLLEVIAPIPIATYIEPSSKVFNQYVKTYFAVYAELFLKIGVIYLLTVLIDSYVSDKVGITKILYLFGLLIFAKLVPDLIGQIFGLKDMAKSFSLNPVKRLSQAAFVGGAVGAVAEEHLV